MKNLPLILPLVLAGCASMSMNTVENLPGNIALKPNPHGGQAEVIDTVVFEHSAQPGNAEKCAAMWINNDSAELKSSSTYVGAYTGNYYNYEASRQKEGGQVLLYVDETEVIAAGREKYSFNSGVVPIGKIADFKVKIKKIDPGYTVEFFDITAAQESTGYASNNGFVAVGAWAGARPMALYQALQGIDERLASCLSE